MTIVSGSAGTENMIVRIIELDGCPMDCTFYRANLLRGFTLMDERDIFGAVMEPCISPLPHDDGIVRIPASEFSGGVLQLGWVTAEGKTVFRWYFLSKGATGAYAVFEVNQFVQRKRNAVQYQTIFVPERR